jgi:hypothetical protein
MAYEMCTVASMQEDGTDMMGVPTSSAVVVIHK